MTISPLTFRSAVISLVLAAFASGICLAKPKPVAPTAPEPIVPKSAYYFTVDLDPYYQFTGTGALTDEQAATSNCYHFSYNDSGKLKQIAYQRAGALMPDPFFGVATIDFDEQPGTQQRTFHNAQAKPIENIWGVAGEELTLNPAGFPTEIINLDASGGKIRDDNGVIRYIRTLDNQNRVVALRRIGLLGTAITDKDGWFETRTIYDDKSRAVERSNHDDAGKLLDNSDGVATIRMTYAVHPDATQITESYFDAADLPVADKDVGAQVVQRTLDPRGLLLGEAYFDNTGAPCLDLRGEIHERRYTYDERGNKTSDEFFGVDGQPKNLKGTEYARRDFKYNDRNLVSEIAFFGDDGTPVISPNVGAAIIKQEYDDKGTLIRRQFFDGQHHPSNHAVLGCAAIRISVNGDTTMVSLQDGADKPMKNPEHGYYSFSYKTDTDQPLSLTNTYYGREGEKLAYFPRVSVINPHLHALQSDIVMKESARWGAAAVGLGALLGCLLALRKSHHTKRRKVYVVTPVERFLGWFSAFAILEGMLRFFMTVYWAMVGYLNGQMGPTVFILEDIFIIFFLYRLLRMRVTMRVLNIERDDIHRLVRDYFTKAGLNAQWIEERKTYTTPPLDVRVRFFQGKFHAYLSFARRGVEGRKRTLELTKYLRKHVKDILAPVRTRALALYYPSVALCYFLLSSTAVYTLWQLIKKY